MSSTKDSNPLTLDAATESEIIEQAQKRGLNPEQVVDLERLVAGDPEALHPEYGFNNDELLQLGIGYGVPGPLTVDQIQREALEALNEMGAS